MFRECQLANTIEDAMDFTYPCYVSEKLDGVRCLIRDGKLYSRTDHEFKEPVQNHFKSIVKATEQEQSILDGELYYPNENFGQLVSTLSSSEDVIRERGLKFHIFDMISKKEWESGETLSPFMERYDNYVSFSNRYDPEHNLIIPVKQYLYNNADQTNLYFEEIKNANGEGLMLRFPDAPYQFKRCKDIVKLKVWRTAEAELLEVHQQSCPIKHADEIKIVNGVEKGFKNTAGSATIRILKDQPLPESIQKASFSNSFLRWHIWEHRDRLVGKTIEFSYLKGGNVGRMARIFRVREDI